ncbi:hypothetical protein EHE19_005470 [Ruminiclostridium herbifermentans]|uniref:Uncharacterized protein n=2 Tax=Ruminiclostridium herbifermentans TaxID=2488810 RepID=A0A7H1VR87_9FIRM|nr:hypothetical protein EHE19_005470 [Ruminiclostridium herbifermentans]
MNTQKESSSSSSHSIEEQLELSHKDILESDIEKEFNDKNKKVITTPEEYEASKLPLLAAIPEKEIYLYDTKDGQVILSIGGNKSYYDWICLTPRFILPQMQLGDFDKDGLDELSVILYTDSGTGVSIQELHIIELSNVNISLENQSENKKTEDYKDHMFSADDYISQLKDKISFKTYLDSGQLMGKISIDTKSYTVSLKEFQTDEYGKISSELYFASIVSFTCENNKLKSEFGVGIICENVPQACYIGKISADVEYNEGKFELMNFSFTEEW